MKLFFRLVLLISFAGIAHAVPITRNLGQGLAYHRVHQLPADLPTSEDARRQACILDLRYVSGRADEAAALAAWLKFHATPRAPVLILANADTGDALLSVITQRGANTSVVVFGAATENFTPDVALKITAADERRAYDAFEHGTPADSLITENADKPRNDEAKLAKDRATAADFVAAPDAVQPPAPSPAEVSIADATTKPKPPAPIIDVALQHAVQLHRTLVALKKI